MLRFALVGANLSRHFCSSGCCRCRYNNPASPGGGLKGWTRMGAI